SLVMLLMWVNYSALILLFGAAFTRANVEARGVSVRPRAMAVCVKSVLLEEQAAAAAPVPKPVGLRLP
ncbi:MAG: YihY/virulence factor BrkB family protein, partial [Parazoarcus communis]